MTFAPMLALALKDQEKLKLPGIASPKLDGVRALVVDGLLVSRTLKPITNDYIREFLSMQELNGFDGELMVGTTFATTTPAVLSKEGKPDFTYYVFDDFTRPALGYARRLALLSERIKVLSPEIQKRVVLLSYTIINTLDELAAYEAAALGSGFEGAMVRNPGGFYKYGRCTLKEGFLLKIKRFHDTEAVIIGFNEMMWNNNEPTRDARGIITRSSSHKNKEGSGILGSLIVSHPEFGQFEVGTGYNDLLREEIFQHQEEYLGKIVKVKYQEIGIVNKPRFPVFLGFRDPIDFYDDDENTPIGKIKRATDRARIALQNERCGVKDT